MDWSLFRPFVAVGLCALAGHAWAQPTLREATEAAWRLTPEAVAAGSRADEFAARARAAGSFLSGAPSIGIGYRTDRVGSNQGAREMEAEMAAPLWWPKVKSATQAQVEADRLAFEQQQTLAKIKIAAEVRDLAAQAAIARIEQDLAARKAQEASALAADVLRRVRAGDSARVDSLQASGATEQAVAASAQAGAALARLRAQWKALTGLDEPAALDESTTASTESPLFAAARAQLQAAQAKLRLVEADRADPPEVGLGVVRERAGTGAANESSLRLALRVPLGSYSRNGPKLAAARADLDVAQAQADAVGRQVAAELGAAQAELEATRRAEAAAARRAASAAEVQTLIATSYRLGESDLPTRLRAEAERYEAERAYARAQVETRRAISKLNQANGLLP